MNKPLVSIITPCYNSEAFLHRLADSILAQNYSPIEWFLVNDGSSDNTVNVAKGYIPKFKEKGLELNYIEHENMGNAASINTALPLFKGEYLCWPDSDDFWEPEFLHECVGFLESNKEFGLVRTNGKHVLENDVSKIICFGKDTENLNKEWIFNDLTLGKSHFFCPIAYLIRASDWLKTNPKRSIYISKKEKNSQNYQMLAPLIYNYKCGYIDKPLYNYLTRSKSLSNYGYHNTFSRSYENAFGFKEIFSYTIDGILDMPYGEKNKYKKKLQIILIKRIIRHIIRFFIWKPIKRIFKK